MSWDLEVDIDTDGKPFLVVESLINFFQDDLESIRFEIVRAHPNKPSSPGHYESYDILDKGRLIWEIDTLDTIRRIANDHFKRDTCISFGFGIHGYGDYQYSPSPEISIFGQDYYKKLPHHTNRMPSEVTVNFGNSNVYRDSNYNINDNSRAVLPKSGRCLDKVLIREALKYICYEVQPKNLYLNNEECVSIPWDYHFIFHSSPEGYAQDLSDLIHLGLHGGAEHYTDSRRNYEASVSPSPTMLFCKRNRGHIKTLQKFLLKYGTQLERKGLPTTFTKEYLEESVLDACSISEEGDPLMDFFFVGEGLGVYAQPLFDRYCESIFLSLISGLTDKEEDLTFATN
jgi:hypothetical protein